MPKFLRKTNKDGLPINGYLLTCGLSAFIMLLGVFLPEMNDIFNWLLNLNGIISPGVTCWIFFAFMQIRKNSKKYPSEYVFIKNDKLAYLAGFASARHGSCNHARNCSARRQRVQPHVVVRIDHQHRRCCRLNRTWLNFAVDQAS